MNKCLHKHGIQCAQYLLNIQVLSLDLNCSSDLHTRKSVGNLFHKTGLTQQRIDLQKFSYLSLE